MNTVHIYTPPSWLCIVLGQCVHLIAKKLQPYSGMNVFTLRA